jgi:hypothetical protein
MLGFSREGFPYLVILQQPCLEVLELTPRKIQLVPLCLEKKIHPRFNSMHYGQALSRKHHRTLELGRMLSNLGKGVIRVYVIYY